MKGRWIEMEKTKKMMAGITATALTLSLVGCSTSNGTSNSTSNGISTSNLPAKPTEGDCNDWEWSEENGVWQCDDSHSSHYRSYYHGGRYYKTLSELQNSRNNYNRNGVVNGNELNHDSDNINNHQNDSNNNKGSSSKNAKTSSGFGSGTKSYGG